MSNPKHFVITVGDYRDSRGRFFSLRTPFHRPLNRALYRIGASWDKEIKCWLLQYNKPNWLQLQKTVAPFGSLEVLTRKPLSTTLAKRHNETTQFYLKSYQEMLYARGYAQNTINNYLSLMAPLMASLHPTPPSAYTLAQINTYRATKLFHHANSTQRQFVGALKLLLILNANPINPATLVRPRATENLPKVITVEQALGMIATTQNIKHRLILTVLYSCGMRRSEVINLKLSDINHSRGIITVEQSKWGKDRLLPLPHTLISIMKEYLRFYQPKTYLIEGPKGGQYSATSIANIVARAGKRVGIPHRMTPHMLRHSYATHQLERGVDVRHIQELLGHTKTDTTMIYTHVAKSTSLSIESPLDAAVKAQLGNKNLLEMGKNGGEDVIDLG